VGFTLSDDAVVVCDGGLATELEARGHDLSDDLWSARLLVDAPDEITAVHTAFFRSGAAVAAVTEGIGTVTVEGVTGTGCASSTSRSGSMSSATPARTRTTR